MTSPLQTTQLFGAVADPFYNGIITSSLRINDDDSSYLSRTPGSTSNRKTFTWSGWFKRGNISSGMVLFGAGTNGDGAQWIIRIDANNSIVVYQDGDGSDGTTTPDYGGYTYDNYNNNSATYGRAVRDTSQWYHLVVKFDTVQTGQTFSDAESVNVYVNGLEWPVDNTHTFFAENVVTFVNSENAPHYIGCNAPVSGAINNEWDGYIAEVNFIDGSALGPDSFGETKNGIWIAKDTTDLTFGTNGFRLQFKGTGTSQNSSGIGADTSGNDNHYAVTNLVASDIVLDTPENNFCINNINLFRVSYGFPTYSEGSLKYGAPPTNSWGFNASTFNLTSGKWYAELRTTGNSSALAGVLNVGHYGYDHFLVQNPQSVTGAWLLFMDGTATKQKMNNSQSDVTYTAWNNAKILGIALNADDKELSFFVDGTLQDGIGSSGIFDISTGGSTSDAWSFHAATATGVSVVFHWNYGQDSTFSGVETAGGNADANGNGDFHTAPPAGFLAVCSANLPEPTIGPNSGDDENSDDYFKPTIFTGDGSDARAITVGFKPDWVWMKQRTDASGGYLVNSSTGNNAALQTTNVNAEGTFASMTFTSTGITVSGNSNLNNENAHKYVFWSWKANGGTATASGSESGNTLAYSAQANTTAGFSIVTYTGNGADSADVTVNHGLGVKPRMVIVKNRTDATRWQIYHEDLSADGSYTKKNILLNTTGAESGYSSQIKSVSSSAFVVRDVDSDGNANVNKNNSNYIAYVFAEIDGYSKFGSYTGNGNANGAFVFTGFRPAFVMHKRINAVEDWHIIDSARSPTNLTRNVIFPNTTDADTVYTSEQYDILSNGFKLRNTGTSKNGDGSTYIYMAFAEQPFKYSNAR